MAKLVSKTYGDALFEVAVEMNRLEEFFDAAQGMKEVLHSNEELSKLMDQPKIIKEDKIKIIEAAFKDKIPKEMVGLMTLLIEKGRFTEMESVFNYFISVVKEEKKIGVADVTTAIMLSDTQKAAVEKKLLDTTRYEEFEMNFLVDKALIGGMVIRIGDRVVDSSVRTRLYELSKELKKIQIAV